MNHDATCTSCNRISELHKQYRNKAIFKDGGPLVTTWCRICGESAALDIGKRPYEEIRDRLKMLDGAAFEHEGAFHTEICGWGVWWRFDEVLEKCYPKEYLSDPGRPFWPLPQNFAFHRTAETKPVTVTSTTTPVTAQEEGEEALERMKLAHHLNDSPRERVELELQYGEVWDSDQLIRAFDVAAFRAPFAVVKKKGTEELGSLLFQHSPRYYFSFMTERSI